MKVAILGLGARGMMHSKIARSAGHTIEAVCDVQKERLVIAQNQLDVKKENCFLKADDFFAAGKLADIIVISTLDETHYDYTLRALALGYDILLEKPIALKQNEIEEIAETAKRLNRKIGVCHVLRYTPFYQKIKELIDSGVIGKVMNINQTENVGYYHYAHSFVRGNWHNSEETCPMILAKCCHDLDLILWLAGKHCVKLSSFGSLDYFTSANQPNGAADRCKDCKARDNCVFNAYQIYTDRPTWVKQPDGEDYTVENAIKQLDKNENFYDKCVFRTDNNVVDHQMVNMVLEDNVLAHLTMQGFSGEVYRRTQVCGTLGEINGVMEENRITLHLFGKEPQTFEIECDDGLSQHSGGDKLLFLDFLDCVEKDDKECKAEIDCAVESHLLAFAAEKSRLQNGETIVLRKEK